jgi:hypothetical protein
LSLVADFFRKSSTAARRDGSPPVFYLLVVILLPVVISAPVAISSTPITTVLVEGNVIVVLVGFMIAISVIIPAWPLGCEATSTW